MDKDTNPTKRRNKFTGKEDISRETADNIISNQIDQLREISRTNSETAAKVRESTSILYEKRISVDTKQFEQLNRHFIYEMECKLQKVKRPSKGLVWYIVMWAITLLSTFLAGYFIQEYREWKERAEYWYNEHQKISSP